MFSMEKRYRNKIISIIVIIMIIIIIIIINDTGWKGLWKKLRFMGWYGREAEETKDNGKRKNKGGNG